MLLHLHQRLSAGKWSSLTPFFFSSRRRHTRLTCDWSSDVCSSDLSIKTPPGKRVRARAPTWWPWSNRSEERRVGKECRSRRSPNHQKKKLKYDTFPTCSINGHSHSPHHVQLFYWHIHPRLSLVGSL